MAKLDLREALAETFEEIREDFGAEAARSRHQGEYRRQLAGKLNKDLRAKLGRPLPADAQAAKALFVQLAAAGMELKNKGISTGSMPLARLSEWLGTYGVSSVDAAALVVPGQHLTLNQVSSENDAPKVASFDPELLTMHSKARPKRLSATCNEAENGRCEALRLADSALRDANAPRNSQPLMRIVLEPQGDLGVCVCVYGLG